MDSVSDSGRILAQFGSRFVFRFVFGFGLGFGFGFVFGLGFGLGIGLRYGFLLQNAWISNSVFFNPDLKSTESGVFMFVNA